MSKVAKLIIDKNIGFNEDWMEMCGMSDSNFSAKNCKDFLQENKDAEEIEVEISCDGGSVSQGFEIYDLLTTSGKKITTKTSKCNSIATVIFMSGSVREITKNAQFFIHNPALSAYDLWGDRLTAEELQDITDDVKASEEKIQNFYMEKLGIEAGSDKETKLKELLSKETDLGSSGALDWGFATAIIPETSSKLTVKKVAMYSDKIAAIVRAKSSTNKNNDMDIKVMSQKITGFEKVLNEIKAFFKKDVKATTVKTDSGTDVYFTEDALAVGVKVYSDEAMTTAMADGDYKTEAGDSFTVKDGEVAVYTAATDEGEDENAKALADKDAEIADLKNQLKAAKDAKDAVVAKVDKLSADLAAFAKLVPGDDGGIGGRSGGNDNELTEAQKDYQAWKDRTGRK